MLEKLDPIPTGRAEDLTGQTFRHLTALYRVANRQGRPTWQCQCDCGRYFTAIARDLKNGKTVSCGCKTNEGKIIDHTGKQYGQLMVLGMYKDRTLDGEILWNCQCSCGNIVQIRARCLKTQKTCGKCFRGRDIKNQKFGKLIALNFDHTSSTKRSIWKCQCDCGSITYVDITDLTSGKTQSCGCIKSRGEEKIAKLLSENNIPFEKQKTFDSCIFEESKAKGIFDFYVDKSYLIEYDGIQHFESLGGWSSEDNVKENQKRDRIKTMWCIKNNIPLIRIPFWHLADLTINDLKLNTSNFIVNNKENNNEN